MGNSAINIDPSTGERVQNVRIDPTTGERVQSVPTYDPSGIPDGSADDAWKAAVRSRTIGVEPGYAYQNKEEIDKQLRERDPSYDSTELDPTIANDIKVGLEGSVFGLHHREQLPEELRNPGLIDRFVSGLAQTVADAPWMVVGGLAGGAAGAAAGSEVPVIGNVTVGAIGAGAGAFALPAAMREALVEGIKNGEVKDFSDLLRRSAKVLIEGGKGAITGAATELAGGLPVGSIAAKSALATTGVRSVYQAAALTTTADVLEGKIPTAEDFAGNAALIVPLNLITRGYAMSRGEAKDALLDVYKKTGKTPQETKTILDAQPPVKESLPPGLRPAIKVGDSFIEGDEGETHSELSERLGEKPVTMEQLESDPSLAVKVLSTPEIHDQDVIDAAWVTWDDALRNAHDPRLMPDANIGIEDQRLQASRGNLKSGRGFIDPESGKFLSRSEARRWMEKNEPDVYEMWLESQQGDKQAELHSEDYSSARSRVQNRNLAEGDETMANAPQNAQRLAAARSDLNEIKAGDSSNGYIKEVLRTLFSGQRDTRVAATTQARDAIAKVIPDYQDQEALSILRDYKDKPGQLATDLEEIRSGDNAKMKRLIPAIEKALKPSPEMMRADGMLTDYYKSALADGRELGFLESTIDPANYSPHILTRILEGEKPSGGVGRPAMSSSTPYAKSRNYPTVLDAMKTGEIDARTVNALDALSVYGDLHATVAATRLLSTELINTELGKYGTREDRPSNWAELDPRGRTFELRQGPVSRSLYVPKDVADAMKPLFEQGLKGTKLAPLLKMQGYVKMLELGLSFFHMKAMSIMAFNNESLTQFTKSLISDTNSPEFASAEREWAADGLTTTKTSTPYEAYKGLSKSSIPTGLDKLASIPVIRQIDDAFKWTTKETFDVVQRKFKVQDASQKAAAWMAKHPDATNSELFSARRSIAKEVNAAYGGLNWDVLGVGKTMRDVSRLFILAPDWTYSNVLNARYAFEGGPAGTAARMFWMKSFATGISMTAAASIAIGGKYDPTDIKHLDQVYLGTDKDGKEMYADWFFAGATRDAITLMKNVASESPIGGTARFIVGKASPLLGMGFGLASNKDRGKPITSADDTVGQKFGKQSEYVAGRVLPISGVSAVKTISDALTDPNHEYTYRDLLELAADTIGSQTIHYGGEDSGSAPKSKSVLPGAPKSGGRKEKRFSILK
jgi:hypothetical protein